MCGSKSLMVALGMILGVSLAHADGVPSQTLTFSINYLTTPGDSVFVLGNRPELGGNNIRKAVKLIPQPDGGGGLDWSIDIAIPQGASFNYSYLVREDAVSRLSDPTNGVVIAGPFAGATDAPIPATRDLYVFVPGDTTAPEVLFTVGGGSVAKPLLAALPGSDLKVARLAGQPNGAGIEATVGAATIDTPLHVVMRRGNRKYNYVALDTATNFGNKLEGVVPTTTIVATRSVGGQTGRGYQVYLPRGYEAHPERSYPVLYMHDGQNCFLPGGPFGSWGAEAIADELINEAQIREIIIVAIDNSSNRLTEYNPHWSGSINAAYNSFIVNELKPQIDANYRTLPGARHTGVCGSSFGGVATLSLLFNHPDVFGRGAAMSTSFWATTFDDDLSAGLLDPNVVLYLDAGDQSDGGDATVAARDGALAAGRTLNRDLFFQIGFGDAHNEAAWNRRFDEALEALFPITDEQNALESQVPRGGDLTGDGCVDLADLAGLLAVFGACESDAGFNWFADGDGSGCVDLADLAGLLAEFGTGCE